MKARLAKSILQILVLSLILGIAVRTLRNLHEAWYGSDAGFVFSQGNASQETRAEITQLLNEFQAGYERRDTSRANEFADRLFSQHNILVLGTMPQEVFIGHSEATKVVQTDWESWGDCTFLVDQANISAFGDVAWTSTIGYVEFDLSRFLVMPLRLTGVAVKEAGTWKFQQLQYQFDLDLSFLLLLIMVLIVLLLASIAVLLTRIGFALVELRETEKPR